MFITVFRRAFHWTLPEPFESIHTFRLLLLRTSLMLFFEVFTFLKFSE